MRVPRLSIYGTFSQGEVSEQVENAAGLDQLLGGGEMAVPFEPWTVLPTGCRCFNPPPQEGSVPSPAQPLQEVLHILAKVLFQHILLIF